MAAPGLGEALPVWSKSCLAIPKIEQVQQEQAGDPGRSWPHAELPSSLGM